MVRYFGMIGYADTAMTAPGVWEDVITEKPLYGDVSRTSRSLQDDQKVNSDLTLGNTLSLVYDAYAIENFQNIRYAKWNGGAWIVASVTVVERRLLLQLGGVYNGITATTPDNSGGDDSGGVLPSAG